MNIKQIKVRITTILMSVYINFFYYFSCFRGFCPTLKERKNENVKKLANNLRKKSDIETLTNILEWQNRNIVFWAERHPMSTLFLPLFFTGLFLGINFIFRISSEFIQSIWWVIAILGSCSAIILVMMILIFHSNRKFSRREVLCGLKNVFWISISINWLLEKKLGICRDYAKLTACLLSNIYPNGKIYFVHAPSHVATGIIIKNKLYMLDQRLPILTIRKWSNYRKFRKSDNIERFYPTKNIIKEVDKKLFLKIENNTNLDTQMLQKLTEKMSKFLGIENCIDGEPISYFEVPWKKGAILYEDNVMVNYSLARLLRIKISNELVELNQITRLQITHNDDDLIFRISFKPNQ